jgi:hypothetical protein
MTQFETFIDMLGIAQADYETAEYHKDGEDFTDVMVFMGDGYDSYQEWTFDACGQMVKLENNVAL